MGNLVICEKHKRSFIPDITECPECKANQRILDQIEKIVARFYGWKLSDQQDKDFTWLVKTLKARLN